MLRSVEESEGRGDDELPLVITRWLRVLVLLLLERDGTLCGPLIEGDGRPEGNGDLIRGVDWTGELCLADRPERDELIEGDGADRGDGTGVERDKIDRFERDGIDGIGRLLLRELELRICGAGVGRGGLVGRAGEGDGRDELLWML